MVRGPSTESPPVQVTIVPSTVEATSSEVRVAVAIPPLVSVRTPRNAGLPCVTSVVLLDKDMLNRAIEDPCGGVMSQRMRLPDKVHVKDTGSSGQNTLELGVRVAANTTSKLPVIEYLYTHLSLAMSMLPNK